jgi:hypothetical protein
MLSLLYYGIFFSLWSLNLCCHSTPEFKIQILVYLVTVKQALNYCFLTGSTTFQELANTPEGETEVIWRSTQCVFLFPANFFLATLVSPQCL